MSFDRRLVAAFAAGLVVGCAAPAFAQRGLGQGGPAPTGSSIVLGCISREASPARGGQPAASTYTIRDPRGEGSTYRLAGDEEMLRLHVGHSVEIRGALTPVPARGGGLATLKIQSLTYISPTCIYK
jgi:hypothetical protein